MNARGNARLRWFWQVADKKMTARQMHLQVSTNVFQTPAVQAAFVRR